MNMYQPPGLGSGIARRMGDDEFQRDVSPATRALLCALQLRGVGPSAVRKFAHAIAGEAAPEFSRAALLRTGLQRASTDEALSAAREKADTVLDRCAEIGVRVVSILDAVYPRRLRTIPDAPPIVFVRGSVAALSEVGCAVVGTREASELGLRIARKISMALANAGLSTISGLARGIDASAHEGALEARGITVAVLAHGLDTVAPTSHRKLAERIVETGGALISEHEPGVPPRPPEFVRRNRLQSGMALCSIMVESGEVGGSIHQAKFTRDQGRPLVAILPTIEGTQFGDFRRAGGERIAREYGALAVANTDELMSLIVEFRAAADKADPSDPIDRLPL